MKKNHAEGSVNKYLKFLDVENKKFKKSNIDVTYCTNSRDALIEYIFEKKQTKITNEFMKATNEKHKVEDPESLDGG